MAILLISVTLIHYCKQGKVKKTKHWWCFAKLTVLLKEGKQIHSHIKINCEHPCSSMDNFQESTISQSLSQSVLEVDVFPNYQSLLKSLNKMSPNQTGMCSCDVTICDITNSWEANPDLIFSLECKYMDFTASQQRRRYHASSNLTYDILNCCVLAFY